MVFDVAAQYRDANNLNARITLHARFSTNPQGWMQWAFEQMRLASGERILEVGAGPATLWQKNLDRVPPGCDITLTDFSPGMVEEARQNLRGSYPHFKLQVANAASLPFEDGGYDVVIANYMLYHVPDVTAAVGEIRRVLKPGGRMYAATLGQEHLREITDLVRRFDPSNPFDASDVGRAFGLENGRSYLEKFFSPVRLTLYEDSLAVTEAAALVAYVASMMTMGAEFKGEKLDRFAQFTQKEVAEAVEREGAFRIRKSQGLFEAYRPVQ